MVPSQSTEKIAFTDQAVLVNRVSRYPLVAVKMCQQHPGQLLNFESKQISGVRNE
jgi:hypothetical protein